MTAPENRSVADDGVQRTVRVGSMPYRDPQGIRRRANAGAVVEVHPSDVARFDRLNVLAGEVWERDVHGNPVQVHTPDPTSDETPSPYPPVDAVAATEDASSSVPETDAEKKAPRKAPAKKAAVGGSE